MSSLYSYVQSTIDDMSIGDIATIDIPDKLGAFRKFLSEIANKDHKKYTTKVVGNQLHIMRINYHSVAEKIVK